MPEASPLGKNMSEGEFRELAAELLRGENEGNLFAVVDAYKAYELIQWFIKNNLACDPLLLDDADKALRRALPWLVAVSTEEALDSLLEHFDKGSCVFIRSGAGYNELFGHLAMLSTAVLPDGETTWLRWYQPCFLRALAARADEANRNRLYGDKVLAFFVENPRHGAFESFEPLPEFTAPVSPKSKLVLTPSLLEHLDDARMAELKRVLSVYHLGSQDAFASAPEQELDELDTRLGELIERVSACSVDEVESLRIMVDAAKFWGWNFDTERPKVAKALHEPGSSGWVRAGRVKTLLQAEQGEFA